MKHRHHAATVRRRIRRCLGTRDIEYDWRSGTYRHSGPSKIVEVSRRVDQRIERVQDELKKIVALIRSRSGAWDYGSVLLPLLQAEGAVKDARSRFVVPLIQQAGLP